MKKVFLWIGGAVALVLGYLWWKGKTAAAAATAAKPTVQTTGTQNTQAPWFPGWNGFNTQSLQGTTSSITSAFGSLKSLANNFGINDGGTNPGVSVSGSKVGGIQSSGSGTGIPVLSSTVQSVASNIYDQTSDAPLNGYDDSDYQNFGDDGSDDSGDY